MAPMGVQDRDWYWEHRESLGKKRARREPGFEADQAGATNEPRPQLAMHPLTKLALGAIGAVLLWALLGSFIQWRAQRAFSEVIQATQQSTARAQLESQQAAEQSAQDRQQRLDEAEAARVALIRAQQDAIAQAAKARDEDEARRTAAWAKFYRKPAACNDAATLECANGYIRAKRAFEQKYAKGEL